MLIKSCVVLNNYFYIKRAINNITALQYSLDVCGPQCISLNGKRVAINKLFCIEINTKQVCPLKARLRPVYMNIKFTAPPSGHTTMSVIAYVEQDQIC